MHGKFRLKFAQFCW